MAGPCYASGDRGFSLIEVLIAVSIFIAIAIGVAQLIAAATRALRAAREHASAVILAAAKVDQLRSLAWAYEPALPGVPAAHRSDRTTDLSDPDHAADGVGLQPSPPGSLASSMPPYVDYLDGSGRWIGNGSAPPPGAVFIRRWAITPFPSAADRTLVLQVLVTTVRDDRSRAGGWAGRAGVDVLLVSVRTRKAQ